MAMRHGGGVGVLVQLPYLLAGGRLRAWRPELLYTLEVYRVGREHASWAGSQQLPSMAVLWQGHWDRGGKEWDWGRGRWVGHVVPPGLGAGQGERVAELGAWLRGSRPLGAIAGNDLFAVDYWPSFFSAMSYFCFMACVSASFLARSILANACVGGGRAIPRQRG